ncbi:Carboxylesterase 5A [Chamberlinius hualienensis]
MRSFVLFMLCSCFCHLYAETDIIVSLPSGKIQGYLDKSTGGLSYYGFRAIPYAEHPKRFQPPEPVKPWSGVHDGSRIGEECPQYEEIGKGMIGDEDCLNINVYTPNIDSNAKLPVMVWIHGGGFTLGSGLHSSYGPQNWMDQPVVLVSFNYRLGALGFLNTEDDSAFGNYGMLDQVLALKWVQKNINYFGGDSNSVTIFGESAGSASVIYHLISPLSKGLFQRAIAQSGTPLNPWAFKKNPLELAETLAERLQCPITDTKLLVNCLKEIPIVDLIKESRQLQVTWLFPLLWSPTVEAPNGHGFLTDEPINLLSSGKIANKVPVILGIVKTEGYFFYQDMGRKWTVIGNQYFDEEFPKYLEKFSFVNSNMTEAHREIAKQYYSNVDVNNKEVFDDVLSQIVSDAMFTSGISKTAELLNQHDFPVHAYVYYHLGQYCTVNALGVKCGKYCSHADELFLQFKFTFTQHLKMNEEDAKMSRLMNGLWASFADNKDLTVSVKGENTMWPLYGRDRNYLGLSLEPKLNRGLLSDKMELWSTTLPNLIKKQRTISDEL